MTASILDSALWQRFKTDRFGVIGLLIIILFALVSTLVWTGFLGQGWAETSGNYWQDSNLSHWFGTNRLGQDIFQRTLVGAATAFEVGVSVTVFSILLGMGMGAISGWFAHTWADEIALWIMGVLDAIPFYLFAAALAFAMHGQYFAMHLAMILTFWTTTARIIRAEVMRLKQREFVEAARAIGLPAVKIVCRHILPNTVHIMLVQATIIFVAAIKTEVILSFLGLGVKNGVSWGLMLAESSHEVLSGQFGNFLAASISLFILLMGFNMLTDALQDAFDSRGQLA